MCDGGGGVTAVLHGDGSRLGRRRRDDNGLHGASRQRAAVVSRRLPALRRHRVL